MNSQESTSLQTDLRKQAEEILQGKAAQSPEQLKALSPEALGALFHELYVHQIELELQNEELRQKQIELDIAKTRYFELYDLAPVAYLTLTQNGLIKQVNFAAQTLLGVSRRSLLNKPLSQFILQADYALYYTFHKQLVESLEQQVLDVRMLKKDGIQFWVHMEAITAQEEDEATILRITLTNITELIKTEIALRESNVYIQSLVDSALDGVIGIDLDGRVISWNPQAVNIFGYSLKQALGREVAELIVPPAYQEAYRQSIVRFKNTGISTISNTRIEVMGMRSDRSEFPLELSISVIRQQESYFFSVFVRDITERKQTENTLSIAATVFESQEGIFITDANSLIIRANQAVYTITGYSEKELAGKTPSLFHSGRQEEGFYTDMWKIIGKTGIWEGEIWNRRKNGEIYPEHLTISSVKDTNGKITNYVATFTDITQSQVAADKIKFLAFYDPLTQLPSVCTKSR
jgi:PAS domain S-box-containing protein